MITLWQRLIHLSTTTFLIAVSFHGANAQVPFSISGPGVDPTDFRINTFATELNFPVGMTELSDGSVLVAVSQGDNVFASDTGSLVRLVDNDNDGVADIQTALVSDVPGGGLTSVRRAGDLILTTGVGPGRPISIYRVGATPSDPLSLAGSITATQPSPMVFAEIKNSRFDSYRVRWKDVETLLEPQLVAPSYLGVRQRRQYAGATIGPAGAQFGEN